MKKYAHTHLGFSLVEVIFVSALSVLVFGALFSAFQYTLKLNNNSRAKLSALSVANDRMEYFRSLPYDDVGTISGIPPGTIPQNSTTTLNGIDFKERVLVEYVDDDADGKDGTATPDSNFIPSDYKKIKIEYTWEMAGETNSIFLVSNIVPRSVETTAGGGTVRINVLDDNAALLSGASVRLINNTLVPVIDVTRFTDANGAALFSGAPTSSDYEVVVTANIAGHDYSTDQTYQATVANPNPVIAPFSVLEADVSTLTFQIGELSDLDIFTYSDRTEGRLQEDFSNLLSVASSSNVVSDTGKLQLDDTLGVYDTAGAAYLGPIQPASLVSWDIIRVAANIPVNTSHSIQLFTGTTTGPYTLIPDVDLPGNATGFINTIVDISELDPITYPAIFVGVTLLTTDTNITPLVDEVNVFYLESATVLSNITFDMQGSKIIGTDLASAPIYKYTNSLTTNASGEVEITGLEFDTYTFTMPAAYDIAQACPAQPFVQKAGVDGKLELVLVGDAANTLLVNVVDGLGRAVPGANVKLSRSGYDVTEVTGICGQVFFTGGVSAATDYTIDVTAVGYNSESIPAFEINDDTTTTIILTE